MMRGQIGKEEGKRQATIEANAGKKHTEKFRKDKSVAMKGVKNALGCKHRPRTEEHKLNYSKSLIGRKKNQISCPHCFKNGGVPAMKRWHFDNCKKYYVEKNTKLVSGGLFH